MGQHRYIFLAFAWVAGLASQAMATSSPSCGLSVSSSIVGIKSDDRCFAVGTEVPLVARWSEGATCSLNGQPLKRPNPKWKVTKSEKVTIACQFGTAKLQEHSVLIRACGTEMPDWFTQWQAEAWNTEDKVNFDNIFTAMKQNQPTPSGEVGYGLDDLVVDAPKPFTTRGFNHSWSTGGHIKVLGGHQLATTCGASLPIAWTSDEEILSCRPGDGPWDLEQFTLSSSIDVAGKYGVYWLQNAAGSTMLDLQCMQRDGRSRMVHVFVRVEDADGCDCPELPEFKVISGSYRPGQEDHLATVGRVVKRGDDWWSEVTIFNEDGEDATSGSLLPQNILNDPRFVLDARLWLRPNICYQPGFRPCLQFEVDEGATCSVNGIDVDVHDVPEVGWCDFPWYEGAQEFVLRCSDDRGRVGGMSVSSIPCPEVREDPAWLTEFSDNVEGVNHRIKQMELAIKLLKKEQSALETALDAAVYDEPFTEEARKALRELQKRSKQVDLTTKALRRNIRRTTRDLNKADQTNPN